MREIGGYFGLECGHFDAPHAEGVFVNSGSSALRVVVRTLGIRRIHVPYWTCPVVAAALRAEGCEVDLYDVGEDLMPTCDFSRDDFILANDYFGCVGLNVARLAEAYPNLVVDGAQSLYAKPPGCATFYSPRKFFGVPDGGIAVFRDGAPSLDLPEDTTSSERMGHLLARLESGAAAGYGLFQRSEELLERAGVCAMSRLTRALLGNCDFQRARDRRRANFGYLQERLPSAFPFASSGDDVPMCYPFVPEDPSVDVTALRRKLIAARIYVPAYWPGLAAARLPRTAGVLPLPCDQRYDIEDLERIVGVMRP